MSDYGKDDWYRKVNPIKMDKGWANLDGRCVMCEHRLEDRKCGLPDNEPCNFIKKDEE